MKGNASNWQNAGIGLIGLVLIGWLIILLFAEVRQAPWQFITILAALIGTLITFAGNLQIQLRNEQRPKKVEIYEEVIDFFFEVIFAQKLGYQPKQEQEMVDFFVKFTPKLVLWASDDVLNSFIKFRQAAAEMETGKSEVDSTILIFGKMLLDIRKDLGHQNNKLNEMSILGVFVNDIENLSK